MLTKFNLAPVSSFFSVFGHPQFRDVLEGEEPVIAYAPRVDVVENKENFIVRAELPGMKKDEVKLKLENNVLTLSGEKRDDEKRDEDNFHLRETRYGKFERSFRLTDNIDRSNIVADYKDGVLTISLPKTKESLSKEIAIKMS